MNKRGVAFRQVVMVFYLVMAAIVILTLMIRAKEVSSADGRVDAYTKNIALTINSMFYSDYNPEVVFNINKLFNVEILEDNVKVTFGEFSKEHNYIPDNNFKIYFERQEDKLILKKVKI